MLYATYGISGGRDRGPRPFFFTIYRWHFDALELISRAKYALFSRIFSRTLFEVFVHFCYIEIGWLLGFLHGCALDI